MYHSIFCQREVCVKNYQEQRYSGYTNPRGAIDPASNIVYSPEFKLSFTSEVIFATKLSILSSASL
jgi:hypothetical protein